MCLPNGGYNHLIIYDSLRAAEGNIALPEAETPYLNTVSLAQRESLSLVETSELINEHLRASVAVFITRGKQVRGSELLQGTRAIKQQ